MKTLSSYRFFLLTGVIVLLLGWGYKAVGATITTAGSGNWNSTTANAPWPGGTVPPAGTDVVIANGHTVTITAALAISMNSITIHTGGTLKYGIALSLKKGQNVTIDGGTLNIQNFNQGNGSNNLGTVTLKSGALTSAAGYLYADAWAFESGTVTCDMAGSGTLTKTTSGTVTLGGDPTSGSLGWNGSEVISAGTLQLAHHINCTGTLQVDAGATLNLGAYNFGSPTGLSLQCGATVGSVITGTGTLTLGGNVTVTDPSSGSKGATISCTLALGTADRTFTVANSSATYDLSITGDISGTGGIIKETTDSYLYLSGSNSYSGKTNVLNGHLVLGSSTALGSTSEVDLTTSSYSYLDLMNGITITGKTLKMATNALSCGMSGISGGNCTWNGTISLMDNLNPYNISFWSYGDGSGLKVAGTIDLGTNAGVFMDFGYGTSNNNSFNEISADIKGAGALRKVNSSIFSLSGNNTFSGGLGLYQGKVNINSSTALGPGTFTIFSGSITIDNTSGNPITLSTNNSISWNVDFTFKGTNNLNLGTGAVTLNTSHTVTTTGGVLTMGGAISDGGSGYNLTKAGAGTLTLNGINTFTGTTTISAGTLKLGNASALGGTSSGTTITSGAVLDLNGTIYSNAEPLTVNGTGISSGGAVINSSTTGATFAGLLTLGSASSIVGGSGTINLNHAGTITGSGFGLTLGGASGGTLASILGTGAGTLTKADAGTWTLSGANTYTGSTTISAGILKLQSGAFSTAPRSYSISSGAVMNIDGNSDVASGTTTITGNGGLRITGSSSLLASSSSGRNITMSLGTDALIDVQNGATLRNGGWSNITWTSNLADLNVDGTLDTWDGKGVIVDALTGSGTIDKGYNGGANSLTVGVDNGNGIFSGVIKNTLASLPLAKTGTGTQTLSGANTYSGSTTVSAGTLKIGASTSALGTTTGITSVTSGAVLDLNGYTLSTAEPLTINGTGISNAGALINSSGTGTGVTYNGAITLGSASSIGTAAATTGNITLGNAGISGGFDLTKVGEGTLNLGSGTATLGALTISTGTLTSTSGTLSVAGDFTNNSTFTHNNGTVTLNKSGSSQSITGSSATTFNNLTINNSYGVTLGGSSVNETVTGTLTFTSGKITTGTNKLIIGSAGSSGTVTGAGAGKYIFGYLRRYVPNSSAPIVGMDIGDATNYTPVSVTFAGTTSGSGYLEASTTAPYQPPVASGLSQTKYINRQWTIVNSNVSDFTSYSPSFTFVDGDKVGSPNTSALIIRKYDGSSWSTTTNGTRSANSTQATGLTSFSDFAIGETGEAITVTTQPSNSTVCSGDNSNFTSASNSTPAPTIQWQRSTNGSVWANITSNLDAGTTYSTFTTETVNLTGTTTGLNGYQYRAVFTNINGSVNSDPATLSINAPGTWLGLVSTSWNNSSNWCGGVPTSGTNVAISSGTPYAPHVDVTNASSNNLTISAGAILTVDGAKVLTVSGTLTNNATATGLVLKSDASGTASLIHTTSAIPATVERYISNDAEKWHFLSSPVAAQAISGDWLPSGTYGNGTGYDLYLWDEPKSCWKYKLNAKWDSLNGGGNYFNVAQGYLYSVQATHPTKSFTGNLNTGTVDVGLKYSGSDPTVKGFNLVGNPYPSSIDWQASSGWTRSALETTGSGKDMWVWNPPANNYGVCNSATGSTGTNDVTRYIAPMQGFFVRAASTGTLSMTNAVRVHDTTTPWKSAQYNPEAISAVVTSETDQTFDEVKMLFGYPPNQTGAAKLFSPVATAPSLYLPAGEANFTVRYLTDTIATPAVPVQFKPGRDGTYALKFSFDNAQFRTVVLEDRQSGTFRDLKTTADYRFNALKTDPADRFVVHFSAVKSPVGKELPATIGYDGQQLQIDLTQVTGPTQLTIYDVLGRKFSEKQLQGQTRYALDIEPGTRLIVVQLKNPLGTLCRKVLCNNR